MPVDELARMKAAGKTPVDAYSMAVAGGYTGTKEQFEADLAASETNASNAASSATSAAGSAESVLPFALNYAPAYSSSGTYAEGDMAVYDGLLYECTEEITAGEEFDPSKWVHVPIMPSVTELNGEIEAFRQRTADSIHSSASGTIAHFTDGANGAAMDSVVVGIEPVQDLHGYSNPWPGGGGKNKFDLSSLIPFNNNVTLTKTADSFTVVNNNSYGAEIFSDGGGTITYPVTDGKYTISIGEAATAVMGVYGSTDGQNFSWLHNGIQIGNTSATFTVSGQTYVQIRSTCPSNGSVTIKKFQFEAGSTATSFAPYANICPITGRTGATVTRCGKNLLDTTKNYSGISYNGTVGQTDTPVELNASLWTDHHDGTFSNTLGNWSESSFMTKLIPAGTYHIHIQATDGSLRAGFNVYDTSFKLVSKYYDSSFTAESFDYNFTLTENGYIGIGLFRQSSPQTIKYPQVELGSAFTSYEPYSGNVYDITFPSEAGTVYGGTLDVTSGVLTVTHGYLQKNTATMDNSESYPGWKSSGIKELIGSGINGVVPGVMLNIAKTSSSQIASFQANTNGSNDIIVLNVNYYGKSQTDWIALAQDVQFVVPLATPVTYQLTPTEVSTLLGTNNVWADTGDTAVGYVADTKLYIELLTKPSEDDMTANANIASGKFFMIGNRLFLSTTAIAQGAAIVPGTNCTEISLADALNQIGEN